MAVNPGQAVSFDLYLLAVLPPEVGPAAGCPNHDALVFAAGGGATTELACTSGPPETFPVYIEGVTVSSGQTVALPGLSVIWPENAPTGPYIFGVFAVGPGSLADGEVDDEDILASAFDALAAGP
jgi:hypothetical protein